jgi:hypothetical protein
MLSCVFEDPPAESDQLQICRCLERAVNARYGLGRMLQPSRHILGCVKHVCDWTKPLETATRAAPLFELACMLATTSQTGRVKAAIDSSGSC